VLAGPASAHATVTTERVVQVVTRTVAGTPVKMLATDSGLSLYVKPTGSCTGGCLSVWPPW